MIAIDRSSTSTKLRLVADGDNQEAGGGESLTTGEQSAWRSAVREGLKRLLELKPDWDTYGAGTVTQDSVLFAHEVLTRLWSSGLPIPTILPTSAEGVLVEWLTDEVEYSIDISEPYNVSYHYESLRTGEIIEGTIRADIRELADLADRLAANQKTIAA